MSWPTPTWREMDRPIKYALYSGRKIVPVKVWSMAPNWNGTTLARTVTLFDSSKPSGTQVDYHYSEIFETREDAQRELFLRKLKGQKQ